MPHLLWILLLALLISCSPSSEVPTHSFRVYNEDGITIAETTGGPKYENDLFTYKYELEIEENEHDDSYLWGKHELPFIDENGSFYIALHSIQEARIAVIDSNGIYQYSFGHKGQGPGEFLSPKISYVGGGFIDVYDPSLLRLTRFNTNGELITTFRLPITLSPRSVQEVYWVKQDRIVAISGLGNPIHSGRQYHQKVVTVTSSVGDTLWTCSTEKIAGGKLLQGERTSWYSLIPYNPIPIAFYSNYHGVLITTGKEPIIDLCDLNGIRLLRIDINLPLEPVTEQDREDRHKWWNEQLQSAPGNRKENIRTSIKNLEYPENKSFWGEHGGQVIQVDEYGYIWIRIPPWSKDCGDREKGIRYRVISPMGEYLGITKQPKPTGLAARVTRDRLIFFKRKKDVENTKIVVYRIRPAVRGLKYP